VRAKQQAQASGEASPDLELAQLAPKITPLKTAITAAQALALASATYFAAVQLEGVLAAQPLPDQALAANVSMTMRSIFAGVVYLAAFMFGVNGLGLVLLAGKLAIFGDDEAEQEAETKQREEGALPPLPDVKLDSHMDDVMAAFDKLSDLSQYRRKEADGAKK
jgi:Protein of unknown function (DUF3082)